IGYSNSRVKNKGGTTMDFEYKRIVNAVDGSKASKKAFQKAVEIAKRNNATLILTHVVDTRTFATAEAYDKSLSERAENFEKELLNEYVEDAKEAGVTSIENTIQYGYPKVTIAKEIASD